VQKIQNAKGLTVYSNRFGRSASSARETKHLVFGAVTEEPVTAPFHVGAARIARMEIAGYPPTSFVNTPPNALSSVSHPSIKVSLA